MTTRRAILLGLAGLGLAAGTGAVGAFREARVQTHARLFGRSSTLQTTAGALEYAIEGDGPDVMMIHGTGG